MQNVDMATEYQGWPFRCYRVEDDGETFVCVAKDAADAIALLVETEIMDSDPTGDPSRGTTSKLVPWDEQITVREDDGTITEHSAARWASSSGRCCVSSSIF